MAYIKINQEKAKNHNSEDLKALCPFGAIEAEGQVEINAACKMCKICVKKGPEGIFTFVEEEVAGINKDEWKGVAVYVDHLDGDIHPITYELLGKANELAGKINHPVYAVFIGNNISEAAKKLLHYKVDKVFVYDHEDLKHFRIEPYTAAFEDFSKSVKPSICLVGGTTIGRSLAPRMAARLRTGLTADCTVVDVQENTDLDQIRPAFGGNIMAHIHTPNHRPQFATVRYKIFDAIEPTLESTGQIITCKVTDQMVKSTISVLEVKHKEKLKSIEEAEVIIVAGRAIKKEEDLEMVQDLADSLGGMMATTRPLIEAGWANPRSQIGLSGRTVKPKLIITCGVSGAIQFVAGMNSADTIIAINEDEKAPIFSVAHYALIGDIYEIIPSLLEQIKSGKEELLKALA